MRVITTNFKKIVYRNYCICGNARTYIYPLTSKYNVKDQRS